jgi:flagellar basal-body rod protein FlgG
MRSLSIASTGMLAQQKNVDVISNNIANMNTTGFKRSRAEFSDLLYQSEKRVGSATSGEGTLAPAGIQIGAGVRAAGVYTIQEQGALTQTGNRFDMAIDGRGYFRIERPDGTEAYTRAGSFQLSDQGELVTNDGFRVMPGIAIPPNAVDVNVTATGQVQVKLAGEVEFQEVGVIELANFQNEAGLEAIGSNLFVQTAASGEPLVAAPGEPGFGTLRHQFLESSNVNAVQEITSLISAQRAYEMNSRVIQTADEMMNTTNQIR